MKWSDFINKAKKSFKRTLGIGGTQHEIADCTVESLQQRALVTPATDIYENGKEFLLKVDVPGSRPKDVYLEEDASGELILLVTPESKGEKKAVHWYRRFQLPNYAVGSRAKATVRNGVLQIRIPKRKEKAMKKIAVRAA